VRRFIAAFFHRPKKAAVKAPHSKNAPENLEDNHENSTFHDVVGFLLLALWFCGMSQTNGPAQEKPPTAESKQPTFAGAIPDDHDLSDDGELFALDLEHGYGPSRLAVTRFWKAATLEHSLRVGMSDENLVQLLTATPEMVIIWRGGAGWRVSRGQGDLFTTTNGATIRKQGDGWTLETREGQVLKFDAKGYFANREVRVSPL